MSRLGPEFCEIEADSQMIGTNVDWQLVTLNLEHGDCVSLGVDGRTLIVNKGGLEEICIPLTGCLAEVFRLQTPVPRKVLDACRAVILDPNLLPVERKFFSMIEDTEL